MTTAPSQIYTPPVLNRRTFSAGEAPTLAYEVVQGPLARFTNANTKAGQSPPTAVLCHGILGSKRNMQTYARMIVDGFPSWKVLLVDLRCHGESASQSFQPPHTVESSAEDVLRLLRQLRLFPHMLIGHSYGGKVVMSMVKQFGSRLPRPIELWCLDCLPGEVRAGEIGGKDHPAKLISTLQAMPTPLPSRNAVVDYCTEKGFSKPIAQWAATNIKGVPSSSNPQQQDWNWSFDLDGISDMYRSYEETQLWPLLENPPEGLHISFVKAEGSNFRWSGNDEDRIKALGHPVHLLQKAGHWVHTDNPRGLLDIMAPSFGGSVDLHMQRAKQKA